MSEPTSTVPIGDLVTAKPGRSRVFEKFGVDYCCRGNQTLEAACTADGKDLDAILAALAEFDASNESCHEPDCGAMSLIELVDHLEATHHQYLKEELEPLTELVEKVFRVHGRNFEWLGDLRRFYRDLVLELGPHLDKEEKVLFPMIRELERSAAKPSFHCGSVGNPIHVMEMEHDSAGHVLAAMRKLTSDYTPPEGACNSFRAMMERLEALEYDLHRHIHKENSILHPKAKALEASL
ncbi:MAG: iron-sulfur cluster repair di-iron protein [Planctomycetes bacterium]|nr:iron-sulfur cluster repair di-iron protein [Planctomycetota bacterium]MCP4771417.1 iron-sulfur cluster repair di-iron protein [Planctomycetota bacterium]MCP4861854.1 iron-sulfur cluster repair di-iron protein [Planctomycetota bacterium]